MEPTHGAGTADAAGPGISDAMAQAADGEGGRQGGRAPSAVGRDTMRRKLAQLDQEIDARVLPEPQPHDGPVELQAEEGGVLGSSMHKSARAHAEAAMPARLEAPTLPDEKVRLNVPAEPVMVMGERARRLPEGRRDLKTIRSNQMPAQAPQPMAQTAAPAPLPVAQAMAPAPQPMMPIAAPAAQPAVLPIQAPVATPPSSPPPQAPALPFQPTGATPPSNPPPNDGALPFQSAGVTPKSNPPPSDGALPFQSAGATPKSNPPPSDGALPFRPAAVVPSSNPPPHAGGPVSPSDAPPPSSGGGQPAAPAGPSPWHDAAAVAVDDTDLPSAHAPPSLGLRPSDKPSAAPPARKPFPVVAVVGLVALGALAVIAWFAWPGAGGAGPAGGDSAAPVGVSAGTTDEPASVRETAPLSAGVSAEAASASAPSGAPAGEPSAQASASPSATARPKSSTHASSPSAAPSLPPTQPPPSAVSTSGRIHLDD
jgi:hypothetical protein